MTVVCGERRVSSIDRNATVNPSLLVEVTSSATEDYDRGEKLSHFKQCPTLQAVMIVSHRRPQVTIVLRNASGWDTFEYRSGEVVDVPALSLRLSVDDLYAGIALDPH